MSSSSRHAAIVIVAAALILSLHLPVIGLPYLWDEAGYYIPAALDIYKRGDLVPTSTLPTGHTPLAMTYLALVWYIFGFSPVVTRVGMVLIAAAAVTATYALARRVMDREPAAWAALLLAVSPMFFAQSTLVFLDLPAALFTTLAVLALVENRWWKFSLMATLALLTKETAVVMLPAVWVWAWWRSRGAADCKSALQKQGQVAAHRAALQQWIAVLLPVIPLIAWTLYYHHKTGFWTGNAEYLQYNLYTTLDPARFFWTLLRRLYEVFIGGFNWLLVVGAAVGFWWGTRKHRGGAEAQSPAPPFLLLAGGLIAVYVLMLSIVGGAVLPRYLLPVFPVFFVACATFIWRLPRATARGVCGVAGACFVASWFINPPYPFAYENNLAYADFIGLHQDAARFLDSRPPGERILTAWPATDELTRPFLGYVSKPFSTVPVEGFLERDFEKIAPESFDVLYIYSRKWEPERNWLRKFPAFMRAQERHFGYTPQVRDEVLVLRYGLTQVRQFERRGQWVRIYAKQEPEASTRSDE